MTEEEFINYIKQIEPKHLQFFLDCLVGLIAIKLFNYTLKGINASMDKILTDPLRIKETPTRLSDNELQEPVLGDYIEFRDSVVYFVKTLTEKLPRENLKLMHKNVSSLNLNALSKFEKKSSRCSGEYNVEKNTISVVHNDLEVLFHELLHLASAIHKNDVNYCGFHQYSKKNSIGYGINEGYTQVLNLRYFMRNHFESNVYWYQTQVANQLETIIGKEKMENLYFNANLKGLVEELQNYMCLKEIMHFIISTDLIDKLHTFKRARKIITKIMIKEIREVSLFLLKAYLKKLQILFEKGSLNFEEMENLVSQFTESLMQKLYIMGKQYTIYEQSDVNTCLEEVFKEKSYLLVKKI